MAEKNSMPERAIAQTEIAAMINNEENREVVHKKDIRMLHGERTSGGYVHPREDAATACCELYTRVFCNYLPLNGKWLTRAGFCYGMAVRIRVMPDCIIITPQNTRELWGCLEGLSAVHINKRKVKSWLGTFPGLMNDTGDLPVKVRDK